MLEVSPIYLALHTFPTRRSSDLFGLGPDTTLGGRSFYGLTETIVGASAVKPIEQRLHLAVYGEANARWVRSEEHTSELQSRQYLVCRLLLEKKNTNKVNNT